MGKPGLDRRDRFPAEFDNVIGDRYQASRLQLGEGDRVYRHCGSPLAAAGAARAIIGDESMIKVDAIPGKIKNSAGARSSVIGQYDEQSDVGRAGGTDEAVNVSAREPEITWRRLGRHLDIGSLRNPMLSHGPR
jgi:hypothetical protein